MKISSSGSAMLWWGTGLLLPFSAQGDLLAAQQSGGSAIEEIIVVADSRQTDPTQIDADAASLIGTAGDMNDPIRALLSLPGITFGSGDLSDPVIRGAGPSDNLFLVDGVPVGDVFHELGDSIISANIVRTFDLYTAAYGAEYGDATGGVIDISLRDPSTDDVIVKLDLSQLKSGALIEMPVTENSSFYASYRHNLAHLFLKNFETGNDILLFQMPESRDYAAKYQWRGQSFDITATAFGAWDKSEEVQNKKIEGPIRFGETETRSFDAQSLRLRRRASGGANFSAILSFADSDTREDVIGGHSRHFEQKTYALRAEYQQTLGAHALKAGINSRKDSVSLSILGFMTICDYFKQRCGGSFAATEQHIGQSFSSTEVYLEDTVTLSPTWETSVGLHVSYDHFIDKTRLEPRLGARWAYADNRSLYARAGLYHKRPQLDRVLPFQKGSAFQSMETSRQFVIGHRWDVSDEWRLQSEVYYKDFASTDLAGTSLEQGISGEAYGIDLLIAKPISQDLYGWASFSYGKSTRTRETTGETYNEEFHAPISATLALNYAFGKGWRLGSKWKIQSGTPYTPLDHVSFGAPDQLPVPVFGTPFSERLSTYSRLDVRLEKQIDHSFADATYYIDVLNLFGRRNVSGRDYPLRNFFIDDTGTATLRPDDNEGVPFFVGLGVTLTF